MAGEDGVTQAVKADEWIDEEEMSCGPTGAFKDMAIEIDPFEGAPQRLRMAG